MQGLLLSLGLCVGLGIGAAPFASADQSLVPHKLYDLSGHASLIGDVAFSPDDTHELSCDQNGEIIYWTGAALTWRLSEPGFHCAHLAFSHDGKLAAAVGGPNKILIIDVLGGAVFRRFHADNDTDFLSASFGKDDNDLLATGSADTLVRIWNVNTGDVIALHGHEWPVQDVLLVDKQFVLAGDAQTIRLWNYVTGKEERRLIDTENSPSSNVLWLSRVAFSEDGNFVVAGAGNEVVLFSLITKDVQRRFSGHTDDILLTRISPDNKYVVSGSRDHAVIVWDVESGKALATNVLVDFSLPSAAAISQDGTRLLEGDLHGSIFGGDLRSALAVWKLDTQQ